MLNGAQRKPLFSFFSAHASSIVAKVKKIFNGANKKSCIPPKGQELSLQCLQEMLQERDDARSSSLALNRCS